MSFHPYIHYRQIYSFSLWFFFEGSKTALFSVFLIEINRNSLQEVENIDAYTVTKCDLPKTIEYFKGRFLVGITYSISTPRSLVAEQQHVYVLTLPFHPIAGLKIEFCLISASDKTVCSSTSDAVCYIHS